MIKSLVESSAVAFNEGGMFMWVILVVFAAALAVALERVIFFFISGAFNGRRLVAETAALLNAGKTAEALTLVSKRKTPLHNLFKTALSAYGAQMSIDEVEEEVEQAAILEVPRYAERLNYLSLFANVATLLGLLGTIAGLQTSFSSLASHEAAQKAAMLANGISTAMNTTAFGLIVAVPCMILFTMLSNRQKLLVRELDESVVRFMTYLRRKGSLPV